MHNFLAKFSIIIICLITASQSAIAQRISDNNTIGWYNTYNTINLTKNTSVWLEYSWRRDQVITNWQQSLGRPAI